MITRGHFIGHIVDNLTDLASRIETRCSLNLTDLNIHVENFIRPILSDCYACNLVNLNEARSNNPGLDLGDKKNRIAFQVTSTSKSSKVMETLKKLPGISAAEYDSVFVLVLGGKQSKYTLGDAELERTAFKAENIVDLRDICRNLMFLELEVVQRIFDHVKANMQRVSIELEIPDQAGNYSTDMSKFMEAIPQPRMGTADALHAYMDDQSIWKMPTKSELLENLRGFSNALAKLPRITRDFYVCLMERRESKPHDNSYFVSVDKLARFASGYDWEGEIRILQEAGFIHIIEPEEYPPKGARVAINFPDLDEGVGETLFEFVLERSIPLRKVFVSLDFSDI